MVSVLIKFKDIHVSGSEIRLRPQVGEYLHRNKLVTKNQTKLE